MSVLNLAWQREFPHVRFNSIWPAFTVATYAVTNKAGVNLDHTVHVAHMADPAYRIVTAWNHGQWYTDVSALTTCMRVANYPDAYQVVPGKTIYPDFMVIPHGLRDWGQFVGYTPLPPSSGLDSLRGKVVIIVGLSDRSKAIAEAATGAGANVTLVDFISGAPMSTKKECMAALKAVTAADLVYMTYPDFPEEFKRRGTLETPCSSWERMFQPACKTVYFYAQCLMPMLLKAAAPRFVIEAPAPVFHPEYFEPSVPYMVIAYMRAMYVIGISAEFSPRFDKPLLPVNAVWPAAGSQVAVATSLALLANTDAVTGAFYAEDVAAMPPPVEVPTDYSNNVHFFDYTQLWYHEQCGC